MFWAWHPVPQGARQTPPLWQEKELQSPLGARSPGHRAGLNPSTPPFSAARAESRRREDPNSSHADATVKPRLGVPGAPESYVLAGLPASPQLCVSCPGLPPSLASPIVVRLSLAFTWGLLLMQLSTLLRFSASDTDMKAIQRTRPNTRASAPSCSPLLLWSEDNGGGVGLTSLLELPTPGARKQKGSLGRTDINAGEWQVLSAAPTGSPRQAGTQVQAQLRFP